jgi:hypothetical protein
VGLSGPIQSPFPRRFRARGVLSPLSNQRRDSLVYTIDELRQQITLAIADDRPCNVILGADINLGRQGIEIPGALPSFRLDGGSRFRIIVGEDVDFVFKMAGATGDGGCPTELVAVDVVVKQGVTVGTVFLIEQSATLVTLQQVTTHISRTRVDGSAGTVTNLFGLGSADLGRVVVDGFTALGITNVFAAGSNLTAWTWCRITDVVVTGVGLAAATWGLGSTSPAFIECVFQRCAGSINVNTGSFSTQNLWSVIVGDSTNTFTTNNGTGGRPQTLVRVSGFATKTLSPDDIDLDVAGGGGGGAVDSVNGQTGVVVLDAADVGVIYGTATATFSGGADSVTVSVVDAGVSAGSRIVPSIAMGSRDADEMEMAPVAVAVGTITAGVGFTIIAVSLDGDAEGAYQINYTRD